MRLLLDTHIVLWALTDDARLSDKARELVSDFSNDPYCSVLSLWEVALKHARDPEDMPVEEGVLKACLDEFEYYVLPLTAAHIEQLETLQHNPAAPPHNDPFDRMLLAQAKSEGMVLVTHDRKLADYGEPCVCLV